MTKNKYIKYCIVGVLAVAVVIGIYTNKHNSQVDVEYTKFLTLVNEKQIEEVQIGNEAKLRFKRIGDDTKYITDNPRTEGLKEKLLLHEIKVSENTGSNMYMLQYFSSMLLFVGLFVFIFKSAKKHGGGSMMSLSAKPVEADTLTQNFSSIAGNIEAKEQVQDVIDFIKEPDKYVKMGARMPKGIILYGPPGTGKTLMAKAIAKEADVAFFSVSGSDFVQLYVGVGAGRVREIFAEARKHKKAVIFIDEIDAIGKKRSHNAANSNDEKDQTLNALLTEMSGFKDDEGIIIIAATNRLDMLDDALLRPGRFDRHIEVGYPDINAREQIIKLYLNNKPVADDVNSTDLAKQTVYFTGAMIENLLNEAAISAARNNIAVITKQDVQVAFYTVIAGKEKKDRSSITHLDRKITAFHEAGHALVTKLVAPDNSVTKVTIIPSTKGAGGFSMNIPKDKMYLTKKEILNQIKICLAGRAAEEIVFGMDNVTTGASNDIEKASEYIKSYIMKYGMDEELGLINLGIIMGQDRVDNQMILEKCSGKIKELYEDTKKIINENHSILSNLAESLLEKETLEESEIASFFQ
ncbi:ATP-dependent metallopeptidase FtsH/Yme1/Tma family protein [Cellulosilyticum sp. I15G10I2]|uniref:ATP-dependent metallopeptidase FtsH/Yme1/Tma family protein n=1 Tax=Cellulosilyticum sp. I15G10I2 TaxID=1892843 RepID=UPI00085C6A30|nr:ATP-dependent metallopeptidase FtsH/Yme1/Tma family protein [Cellulosilyticum sp. I15G10I2]